MPRLYLLKGSPDAPGWGPLQRDTKDKKVDVLCFDRDRWALIASDTPPEGYEGMTPTDPADGLYLDNHGRATYVIDLHEAGNAYDVLKTLGEEATLLLEELVDPDLVLERLGKSY